MYVMTSISKIIQNRLELEEELRELTNLFESKKKDYLKKIAKCKEQEQIVSVGLDLDKIELGKKILYIHGNPYGKSDDVRYSGDNFIAKEAIKDILNGCKHLRKEFFGNKVYEGYYQRCDCKYGYGPSHGGIVDEIGLKDRDKELTEDEIEATVYYLTVWQQLPEAHK